MFKGCTALSSAPELPATELSSNCYRGMFGGCTSLVTAPVLPATKLVSRCYQSMFADCINLNFINVEFTKWSPATATLGWTDGIETNGTFICSTELPISTGINFIPEGWNIDNPINPLTFTALESNSSLKLKIVKGLGTKNTPIDISQISAKVNNDNWILLSTYNEEYGESINSGTTISFRNGKTILSDSVDDYVQFEMSGKFNASRKYKFIN